MNDAALTKHRHEPPGARRRDAGKGLSLGAHVDGTNKDCAPGLAGQSTTLCCGGVGMVGEDGAAGVR